MMREVPDGWVEFTDAFIEEVRIGLHAGWTYSNDGFGENLVCWPEGAAQPAGAWTVKRDRVLGSPARLGDDLVRAAPVGSSLQEQPK
jgi:hypothetical protein